MDDWPSSREERESQLRILVVGSSLEISSSHSSTRRQSVIPHQAHYHRLTALHGKHSRRILLDERREDWPEYVHDAAATVVVVDQTQNWLEVALEWTSSIAEFKTMPVALLFKVDKSDFVDTPGAFATFKLQSELKPVVGPFFASRAHLDDSSQCVSQLVRVVEHNKSMNDRSLRQPTECSGECSKISSCIVS